MGNSLGKYSGDGIGKSDDKKAVQNPESFARILRALEIFERTINKTPAGDKNFSFYLSKPDFTQDKWAPDEILTISRLLNRFEEHQHYKTAVPQFISTLVKEAYERGGHNDFKFDFGMPMKIASVIRPGSEDTLNIEIYGDVERYFVNEAARTNFKIHGKVLPKEEYGNMSLLECTLICDELPDNFYAGRRSVVKASKTGNDFAYFAQNSVLIFSETGENCGAEACASTFITDKEETYRKITRTIPKGDNVIVKVANIGEIKVTAKYGI